MATRLCHHERKTYCIPAAPFISHPIVSTLTLPLRKRGRGRSHPSPLTFRGAAGGRARERQLREQSDPNARCSCLTRNLQCHASRCNRLRNTGPQPTHHLHAPAPLHSRQTVHISYQQYTHFYMRCTVSAPAGHTHSNFTSDAVKTQFT